MPKKETDEDVMGGHPKDGENIEPDPKGEDDDKKPTKATNPSDVLVQEFRALRKDMAELRKPDAARQQPAKKPNDDLDIERTLFEDPKGTLERYKEQIKREVAADLEGRYQQDQNQQRFWNSFYEKYKDLADDRDLVELTLNTNLKDLADMRADDAMDRLADLTRDRIIRYTGGKSPGKKAVAEGAQSPSPAKKKPEEDNITSLSDLIKRRRESRRTKASGA